MRIAALVLLGLVASEAGAQGVVPSSSPRGAEVSGTVYDSLAGSPLAGAVVQLAAADDPSASVRTVGADRGGRFTFGGVPAGRYVIGFLHPILDSLGVEPPNRALAVRDAEPVRLNLAVPSGARLRYAICGSSDSSTVLVGIVREAEHRSPLPGAEVTGEWFEYAFRADGVHRKTPRLSTHAAANGWFALCGIPRGGVLVLQGRSGADSTDRLEIEVPDGQLLRRDLYLGSSQVGARGAAPADSGAIAPHALQGVGRLAGTVVSADGGQAVAGARVAIADGPSTQTNERGEWTLTFAPMGTRTLEVRGIGYYPSRTAVDIVPDAPPVRVALSTLRAVLDTIRVTASRHHLRDTGFDHRRRAGMGRYLGPEEVARMGGYFTSDLLRMVSGVQVERVAMGATRVLVRGMFGWCPPAVYVDGQYMRGADWDMVNDLAAPDEIAGIEVYNGVLVPGEFSPGMSGCGSIVIWTKPRQEFRRKWTLARVAKAAGVVGLGIGLGRLVLSR